MKETAEESAVLKQRLKHEPFSPALAWEAAHFPAEASEAVEEVEQGYDSCSPGSYVYAELHGGTPMKVRDLIDQLSTVTGGTPVCVAVDGGYKHVVGLSRPDGNAVMIPTIEIGQEVDFRWPHIDGPSMVTDVAPHPPAFGETPKSTVVSKFDFPRLREMLDRCVGALNDVVVAQTKDDGFDMPVGVWKAIEQADILVNSARDAIPTRTVIRYPAWIDLTVETRAEDDHTIVKSVALAQQGDAGRFGPNTRPYVIEAENQDLADAALRYTEISVWPEPKLEG